MFLSSDLSKISLINFATCTVIWLSLGILFPLCWVLWLTCVLLGQGNITSCRCAYLCFHSHRNRNGNCYSPAGVEYTLVQGRRILKNELFRHNTVFCFDQSFSFLPHVEGDGRTHEKHASPQRTGKPEGKVWEQSFFLVPFWMSLSGRTPNLFPKQAELHNLFLHFTLLECLVIQLAMNVFSWCQKLRRQTMMWKKAHLHCFDCSEIKLLHSWQFRVVFFFFFLQALGFCLCQN